MKMSHKLLTKVCARRSDRMGEKGIENVTANPTDMGPGLTVPGEQLSHGRDSSNVSGHAIPAILHGNQCNVL